MTTDYKQLAKEHAEIAKDLLRVDSARWNEFFAIMGGVSGKGGYLVQHYERRLREDCRPAQSVEDFCQFLQQYLQQHNNYVLTVFCGIDQHFFQDYFTTVLKDVYRQFFDKYGDELKKENLKRAKKGLPPLTEIPLDDRDEDHDPQETISKSSEDSNSGTKLDKDIHPNILYFAQHPIEVWKNNQKDFLTLWMAYVLKYDYGYIAHALNFPKANAVAARIRNFKKKELLYAADGASESKMLNEWLNHSCVLQFITKSPGLLLSLHLPFDCTEPDEKYIRLELRFADGKHVRHTGVKFGNIISEIKDGWGKLKLSEFHTVIEKKVGCVKIFDSKKEFEAFPIHQPEQFVTVLTDELFQKWSSSSSDSARFIADFGTGLAWLLNRNMDYERYGAPGKFDYDDLDVVPQEALCLFGTNHQCDNGILPQHGFVFPLEWRFHPEYANPYSPLLPQPIIDLAKKIAEQQKVDYGWGLHPSFRFFHDQIDFSKLTILGSTDESVASAYLSLSAALTLAVKEYTVPKQLFASAQYDWQTNSLQKINLLDHKLHIASNWTADKFFVAGSQKEEAKEIITAEKFDFEAVGCDSATQIAFHHLESLRPDKASPLKTVADPEQKFHRPELATKLSALTNAAWDKKEKKSDGEEISLPPKRNSFVILSGNPGMGKSILMSDIYQQFQKNHTVWAFACNAGDKNCVENFIKSMAYQIAATSPAFAAIALNNLAEMRSGAAFEEMYQKLVYEPLIATADRNMSHRYYILVDGLDEEASGKICDLLTDDTMQFPANYAVVVSTRPISTLLTKLKTKATGILDLGAEELSQACAKDLKSFIRYYVNHNEDVRSCWLNAGYNDDELVEKISQKDKSFLYAQYVLQGVADGMYDFDQLDQELPAGLTAFYQKSFEYRFDDQTKYDAIRPLLKLLLEKGSVSVEDASHQIPLVGRSVKLLQGYCVVSNNILSLSDASLREWLQNSMLNPDFAIF